MTGRSVHRDARRAPVVARSAVDRGLDIATTVKDSAAEAVRRRRDPAHIAERRRVAARRRLLAWSIPGLVLLGVGANSIAEIARGDSSAANIGAAVLFTALFVYCVIGSVQAARDLRARNKVVRMLPPPGPGRRAVTGAIRPLIARLDAYSDALRHSVGMIGISAAPAGARGASVIDDSMQQLRNETLWSADSAEVQLRTKAAEYSALIRGSGGILVPEVGQAGARLEREIRDGVDEYGRLIAAASDAAGASQRLAGHTALGGVSDIADLTDRLTALAAGMREITGQTDDTGHL
ncbi:MAG: hypothetical protein ABI382_12070 [Nakamurella sp.]